LLESWNFGGGM